MTGQELARKIAFFRDLETLTDPNNDDEEEDAGIKASMLAMQARTGSVRPHNPPVPATAPPPRPAATLVGRRRTVGANTPAQAANEAETEVEVVKDTTSLAVSDTYGLHHAQPAAFGTALDKSSVKWWGTSESIGKRKRAGHVREIPDEHKVFMGLRFYFFPNNAIAPARRMRIQKAVEYGAEWVPDWDQSVSHIIVDKNLTYMDVLKHLKLSELPPGVLLVDESYAAQCIAFRCLVEHSLPRFQVKGVEEVKAPEKAVSDDSGTSLQLKPAKGPDLVYEPHTPSRAEESIEDVQSSKKQNSALEHDALLNTYPRASPYHVTTLISTEDPLQEAIANAKALAHLPLDSDDEEGSRPSSANITPSSTPSDSEHGSPLRARASKSKRKYDVRPSSEWQQRFQCMQSHSNDNAENPNQRTIDVLQEMENYYSSIRDTWRTRAYRQAIATLRKQNSLITTKDEAEALPLIGARLAAKIEEISWTGKLQRLENTKLESSDQALQKFLGIYGVGFSQASKWVRAGHRTLEDLATHVKLTPNQTIGIEHYDDFKTRIPRAETAQLGAIVASALCVIDPGFVTIIGGSYRRGADDSGDIDMIITKKDASSAFLRAVVLGQVVPRLEKQGFLVAALAVTDKVDGSKWHGACQLPCISKQSAVDDAKTNGNPWRRIDFLLVPWDELGAAKIYFTGNDIFNRSMRLLARKKGMVLNQRGLYKDVLRQGTVKLTDGTKIEGASEEAIFKALGVPWREAWERNI